jgi:hypothetical protein
MARIRSIKPELRTSLVVSSWPMEVRYFFVLLWGYLDDYGRGVDDELLITSDCFPRDRNVTPEVVGSWLELLADAGPVCRYEVDGRSYLHCPNWGEHQRPQHPGKPRVPPCPDDEPGPFKDWRADHPQRIRKPSRKSHEGLRSSSPVLSGASARASGGGVEGASEAGAGPVTVLRPSEPLVVPRLHIVTGQSVAIEAPEALMSSSGGSHEILTPEQGAGSRDIGAGRTTSSVNVEATLAPRRADVEEACSLLADLIEANGSKRPTITTRWRNSARLMLDRDGRTLDQVLGAIRWCQADSFWCGNVLSMPKLREKYDQLRLAAQRSHGYLAATGTDGHPQSTADRRVAEALALAARLAQEDQP